MWIALCYFVLYFCACGTFSGIFCYISPRVEYALVFCVLLSACETLSGILSLIFQRVEFALVFCVNCFCMWNMLWYFVGMFFCVWNALWYCAMLCYIFLGLERSLVLWNFVLYISAFGTRSGIVECCVIFFFSCNVLLYCEMFCYISLRVEHALVLRNCLLY